MLKNSVSFMTLKFSRSSVIARKVGLIEWAVTIPFVYFQVHWNMSM